jgi:hypothetical protein
MELERDDDITQTAGDATSPSRRALTEGEDEDADADGERQCSVCMSDFTRRVLLKDCGHPFWYTTHNPRLSTRVPHITPPLWLDAGGAMGISRFGGVETRPARRML